ncbi:MAG: hypothetical protein K1000chlam4_00797 [Chlamydiae bacterium]|nr:hypothetical protein [Chlamydiota bacterium]
MVTIQRSQSDGYVRVLSLETLLANTFASGYRMNSYKNFVRMKSEQ